MSGINLLPWREERRIAKDRQLLTTAVLIWVLCAVSVFGGYSYLGLLQENQNKRNSYLNSEISKLDEKIKEINKLRSRKDNLIARMQVIQNLQSERTQVVHLLDDMVRKLPDGVYFDTVEKREKVLLSKEQPSPTQGYRILWTDWIHLTGFPIPI